MASPRPSSCTRSGCHVGQSWIGLSWVAVWMLLFNVVVPTAPRYAVIAALLSVTAVPAMVLLSLSMFPPESRPTAGMIFFGFGFGYLLVVIMAYVGARVVYGLGTEVTRARELGSYRLEHRLGQGEWAKCGARATACSHGRRPSS